MAAKSMAWTHRFLQISYVLANIDYWNLFRKAHNMWHFCAFCHLLANLQLDAGMLLDTIDPSDFLLLGSNENMNMAVEFRRDVAVEGDLTVGGSINTVDIEEVCVS